MSNLHQLNFITIIEISVVLRTLFKPSQKSIIKKNLTLNLNDLVSKVHILSIVLFNFTPIHSSV